MPRGKQSGIHYGQKKQNGQSDLEQLILIKQYLKKRYKINAWRNYKILFNKITDKIESMPIESLTEEQTKKFNWKEPDISWIDKYGLWVIEVDGAVHDRKVEKTRKRNELFIKNRIKLIVVNLADIKELGLNIYDYIDDMILERIRG